MKFRLSALTLSLALLPLASVPADAGVMDDIAAATSAGRLVFVAVSDGVGPGMTAAQTTAQRAQTLAPQSVVVGLNRKEPSHAPAVQRLGLAQVEVPLVLLMARNGLVVAQERPAEGAAERLVGLVPGATVLTSVATANAAGRPVFLVVSDGSGANADAARAAVRQAHLAVPSAVAVELDRTDPRQADAVAKFRLAAAPVPIVIVVASNGVPTGAARPGDGAAARLASLVPSKAKADYLKQLSEQRIAVVLFTRANMAERSPLFEAASAALQQLPGKIALVTVDLDDAGEAQFSADLKVDRAAPRPVTVVVNPKGQILGRFDGAATTAQIAKAAGKKSCCDDPNCKDCGK
jgi:hypothetical protein